tara:strand:- start:20321 stop:20782 length:462 start_codon:yes stop_codon:yes gene_type:complete
MDVYEEYPHLLDFDSVHGYDFASCYTRMNPDEPILEVDLVTALASSDGNMSRAAKLLGRSRRHCEGVVTRDARLSAFWDDLYQEFLDEAETAYKNLALTGDGAACKFFLTTKGKNRGYGVVGDEDPKAPAPVNVIFNTAEPVSDVRVTRSEKE